MRVVRLSPALLAALLSFDVDDGPCAIPYVARLARANRWSTRRARRVFDEYRRFLVLRCGTDELLSPSRDVDEAWHLHLTYTRSYWERLCRDLVGQQLHHTPGRGDPDEARRFRAAYARTRALYRDVFGVDPPRDIWPP